MFWGELIYATPGSGKTHVASFYCDVIDADDLIVRAIHELTDFDYEYLCGRRYTDPREVIQAYFSYIHFKKKYMDRVYDRTCELIEEHKARQNVVLLGTRDLIHLADRVFIQGDKEIVRAGFNQRKESDRVDDVLHDRDSSLSHRRVHHIYEYLHSALHRLAAARR
jgi:hypothetical protein